MDRVQHGPGDRRGHRDRCRHRRGGHPLARRQTVAVGARPACPDGLAVPHHRAHHLRLRGDHRPARRRPQDRRAARARDCAHRLRRLAAGAGVPVLRRQRNPALQAHRERQLLGAEGSHAAADHPPARRGGDRDLRARCDPHDLRPGAGGGSQRAGVGRRRLDRRRSCRPVDPREPVRGGAARLQ